MFKSLFRLIALPLLLTLATAGFSSPAHAGYKFDSASVHSSATGKVDLTSSISACRGHVFNTISNLNACIGARMRSSSQTWESISAWDSAGFGFWYKAAGGVCTQSLSGVAVGVITSGSAFSFTNSGMQYIASLAFARQVSSSTATPVGASLYSSGCVAETFSTRQVLSYTIVSVPEPGDDGPSEPDSCQLSAAWGAFALPPLAAGTKPALGHEFVVAYRSAVAGYPAHYTDGGTDASPTFSGTLQKVTMGPDKVCIFRRDHRKVLVDQDNETQYVYTLRYVGNGGPQGQELSHTATEIVVTGSSKKSKPGVPYGTKFVATKASVSLMLDKALGELIKELSDVRETKTPKGQPIPVKVEVKCKKDANGACIVDYHHPDPEKLKRDNPACVGKFDARCAWSPSPTVPATAETKKEDLVRLSEDGQTIVYNNTTIYKNTVYPAAMVAAGTAPDNTKDQGSTENPADGEQDGDDGGLSECLEDKSCELTEQNVRDYLTGIGVDDSKDHSATGVSGRIIGNAVSKGKCNNPEANSAYCGMVAAFGLLGSNNVPQSGDFLVWRGNLTYGGKQNEHEVWFPGWVLDLIEVFMKISLTLSVISITLRGRPW